MGDMVKLAQELDSLEVFAAAKLVGNPLSLLARVIQVEHGGHRIDPQTVNVEPVAPKEGIGQQEIGDFVTSEVEDQGSPILVCSFARVLVLEQGRAVEAGQSPVIPREVRRDPINNHPNSSLMEGIDEKLEILRRPKATR